VTDSSGLFIGCGRSSVVLMMLRCHDFLFAKHTLVVAFHLLSFSVG